MKVKALFILIITLSGTLASEAKGDGKLTPEESYYRQSSYRSWAYGEKLLKLSIGPERRTIEVDLAAAAFGYFYLLENGEIKKNPIFEMWIKRIFENGNIRQSISNDPLNRSGCEAPGNPRGTSSHKILKDEDHEKLKLRFVAFVKAIE